QALTPPHPPGSVDVTVSDPVGSATLAGAFTYFLPPRSGGYWMDASDGGIFPYGNAARGLGSHGGPPPNQPIVGMAPVPDGRGCRRHLPRRRRRRPRLARRHAAEQADRRHGGDAGRRRLLAGGVGRRHLPVRRRDPVPGLARRLAAQPADRGHGPERRRRRLLA